MERRKGERHIVESEVRVEWRGRHGMGCVGEGWESGGGGGAEVEEVV